MNEHQKHTEFLRQCIGYDQSARCRELDEGITWIQRDLRCVRRAAWLIALLLVLTVTGLGYGVILVDNFPDNMPPFIINLIWGLGMGLLFSLLGLMALAMAYRLKLNRQREECRQLVTKLLESRLGKPVTAPSQNNCVAGEKNTPDKANGSQIQSAAQG